MGRDACLLHREFFLFLSALDIIDSIFLPICNIIEEGLEYMEYGHGLGLGECNRRKGLRVVIQCFFFSEIKCVRLNANAVGVLLHTTYQIVDGAVVPTRLCKCYNSSLDRALRLH